MMIASSECCSTIYSHAYLKFNNAGRNVLSQRREQDMAKHLVTISGSMLYMTLHLNVAVYFPYQSTEYFQYSGRCIISDPWGALNMYTALATANDARMVKCARILSMSQSGIRRYSAVQTRSHPHRAVLTLLNQPVAPVQSHPGSPPPSSKPVGHFK